MLEMPPKVGQTYRVEFQDCCVGGEFTSKLVEVNEEFYTFENGVSIYGHAVTFEKVDVEEYE